MIAWFVAVLLVVLLLASKLYKYIEVFYYHIISERRTVGFIQFPGYPVIGNLLEFRNVKKIFCTCMDIMQRYGNTVRISLFYGFPILLITDLNFTEYVLSTTHILDKAIIYTFLERWLGSGLLTSEGPKWKKTRKIMTPAFHFKILEHYATTFHSASDILLSKLRKECGRGSFNVYPYITLCTLDIICESAMGTKVNAQQKSDSEYVKGVQEICRIIVERVLNPFKLFDFTYKFTNDYKMEKYYLNILHSYTQSVISSKRKELLSKNKSPNTNKRSIAFLDLILEAEIDGRPMTDDEIRQEVDTFMFEGHDTTASGISFALYCLSINPNIQEKVVTELRSIFGDDKSRPATFKELNGMKYLEMVIKETLRLYPSVPFYARTPNYDINYSDKILPKYIQLVIFPYGIHRDPAIYPEPEKFDPDRFLPENQLYRHPFSYLAFSAGSRNCIGQKFAMLEMKNTISHILRNFVINPAPNFVPELLPLLVLKSMNGVLLQLEERL